MIDRKQAVRDLLKSIETGAQEPAAIINPDNYVQHNLGVADGLAGFGEALAALPPGSARVDTKRVFEDGDYVFAHTDYDFFGPKIGFDIFRFEDGEIVEHWDNLQETVATTPSGHTMVDGPTEATDLEKTDANKALVSTFLESVLVGGKFDTMTDYVSTETYIQHNPQIGDGLDGLGAALEGMAAQGVTMVYDKVHIVLGEGNFVLSVSEGSFANQPTTFYDLFRVEDGKIVEHWDVIEPVAPRDSWKHENGKFGFR
ncbi:MAG: nuclear transport factor 2 family protein [Myxococcota bacterium]